MMLTHGFSVTFSPLSLMQPGEQGTLYKFRGLTTSPQLQQLGLRVGVTLTVERQIPDLVISVQGQQLKLSPTLAQGISVRLHPTCPVSGNQVSVWQHLQGLWGRLVSYLRQPPDSLLKTSSRSN